MIKSRLSRFGAALGLLLAVCLGATVTTASPASASAQTCIGATGGYVCTNVSGSGTWVNSVGVSRGKSTYICNYSAWFFYVPPSGGAYGLGYQSRAGCVFNRAWFDQPVNRSFPRNTLVCAKFYEDYNTLIGEKCVGVS
jgi:hypothetical protein